MEDAALTVCVCPLVSHPRYFKDLQLLTALEDETEVLKPVLAVTAELVVALVATEEAAAVAA